MLKYFHLFNFLFIYIILNDLILVLVWVFFLFKYSCIYYSTWYRGVISKTFSCFLLLLFIFFIIFVLFVCYDASVWINLLYSQIFYKTKKIQEKKQYFHSSVGLQKENFMWDYYSFGFAYMRQHSISCQFGTLKDT